MAANPLTDFSNAVAQLVRTTAPHVVRIDSRRRRGATASIYAADGTLVASHHAIEREEDIPVTFADGKTATAKLLGRDQTTDLAVLKVDATGLPAPAWADTAKLETGQLALAVGRPGRTARAAFGIVHAAGADEWRTPAGGTLARYVELDYELPPGFSGGPVVDAAGAWLGVSSSAILRGATMVVPATTVARVAAQLVQHGRLRRGYLGVGAHPVRLPDDLRAKTGQQAGLLVFSVDPAGPAHAAGLGLGDTIVSVDGVGTGDLEELFALLGEDRIGRAVPVKYVRAGDVRDASITVGERK
jgi:S1-C subfamily serine protease